MVVRVPRDAQVAEGRPARSGDGARLRPLGTVRRLDVLPPPDRQRCHPPLFNLGSRRLPSGCGEREPGRKSGAQGAETFPREAGRIPPRRASKHVPQLRLPAISGLWQRRDPNCCACPRAAHHGACPRLSAPGGQSACCGHRVVGAGAPRTRSQWPPREGLLHRRRRQGDAGRCGSHCNGSGCSIDRPAGTPASAGSGGGGPGTTILWRARRPMSWPRR